MGKSIFNVLGVMLIVAIMLIMIQAECASGAENIRCEGEEYVADHNIGGYEIAPKICPNASGGRAVNGVDIAEEWVELAVTLPESPCWSAVLVLQTYQNEVSLLKLSLFPESGGDAVAFVDFMFTGVGIDCTLPYLDSLGDEHFCVQPGDYRARIELVAGELTRIDLLMLSPEDSPVEPMTWSLAKSLYDSP